MQCVSVFTRILPACAGVNPYYRLLNLLVANSPRMRGGQPDLVIDAYATFGFSPACAGVNPTKTVFLIPLQRHSPRMRGGQPSFMATLDRPEEFSPHARGSTFCRRTHETTQRILPARAGVNPYLFAFLVPDADSPHMRGGQPNVLTMLGS